MFAKGKAANKNFRTIECLTALKHLPEPGRTTFTRPSAAGEPPDVRVKGGKPKFSKQELLEFFTPLFALFNAEIKKAEADIKNVEYDANRSRYMGFKNGVSCCYVMLQEYIEQNGGE